MVSIVWCEHAVKECVGYMLIRELQGWNTNTAT